MTAERRRFRRCDKFCCKTERMKSKHLQIFVCTHSFIVFYMQCTKQNNKVCYFPAHSTNASLLPLQFIRYCSFACSVSLSLFSFLLSFTLSRRMRMKSKNFRKHMNKRIRTAKFTSFAPALTLRWLSFWIFSLIACRMQFPAIYNAQPLRTTIHCWSGKGTTTTNNKHIRVPHICNAESISSDDTIKEMFYVQAKRANTWCPRHSNNVNDSTFSCDHSRLDGISLAPSNVTSTVLTIAG